MVLRPRLIERLSGSLCAGCKLNLISAPAGSAKTTLASQWIASCERPAAWLSLDEADNDPARFLAYLVAALQTILPGIGEAALDALNAAQPSSTEDTLTALLNELAVVPHDFILVLDDYHLIDAKPVDDALAFLLEHLPPRMHLVYVAAACVQEAHGNLDLAYDLLCEAERPYVSDFSPNVRPIAAMKARVRLTQERLSEALDWVAERGLSPRDELSYVSEFEHVPLARSTALAESRGYLRIFVARAWTWRVCSGRRQDAAWPRATSAPCWQHSGQQAAAPEGRAHPLLEALSERELEVLRLLETDLTGPEIADKLLVSVNTLRIHTKNIFGKLAVNNRRAAVHRAEELGLL